MMIVHFSVPGKAQAKGSWRAISVQGKPRLIPDSKKSKPWEDAVRHAAYEAFNSDGQRPLIVDAVRVQLTCYFSRPKSHFGTGKNAEVLKPTAPLQHTKKPDADKLVRNILDAMSGVVYHDDSQVSEISICKRYTIGSERAVVTVTRLEG